MNLESLVAKIKVWKDWNRDYNYFVPKFIEEAKTKENYQDWNPDIFYEFFEKSKDQCVSSLQQGYFTNSEKEKIKRNWSSIGPLLKQIALKQDELQIEVYQQLAKAIRKHTTQNRVSATNRMIAGLQPKLLCTVINHGKLIELISFLEENIEGCSLRRQKSWYKNSKAVLDFFTHELQRPAEEIMTLPWQTYEYFNKKGNKNSNDMSESEVQEEANLLKFKKQIILQGPPGTGKTRKAVQLAKELTGIQDTTELEKSGQMQIVQFHPTYSYEDFVEGLKPKTRKDGQITFETEDGIFKKFCKSALISCLDSNESAKDNNSFENLFIQYTKTLKDKPDFTFKTKNGVELVVDSFSDSSITVKYKYANNKREAPGTRPFIVSRDKLKIVADENIDPKEVKTLRADITPLVGHIAGELYAVYSDFYKFIQDSSIELDDVQTQDPDFQSALEEFNELQKENKTNFDKPFVFIIDEMNRANLSTVLGELISLMEEGKRLGASEQMSLELPYSKEKFGIPKNLYIIGTMNTADRSVSHIDYAVRRRFAFINVLPYDLSDDPNISFDDVLFKEVERIFVKSNGEHSEFLSREFMPKDVQLGHSYFINKDDEGGTMDMRLDFEIKPILREYVKDGILKESAIDQIENLSCS